MKILKLIAFSFVCSAIIHAADTEKISHVSALAARLESVEGCAVGDAAQAGRFHLLARFVIRGCQQGDVDILLRSESPLVRLLGYQCALAMGDKIEEKTERALLSDKTKVLYFPYGCGGGEVSIGRIAHEIKSNPDLLLNGPDENRNPNRPAEPGLAEPNWLTVTLG